MIFNPLFIEKSSGSGSATVTKNAKIADANYLFNDIINVFTGNQDANSLTKSSLLSGTFAQDFSENEGIELNLLQTAEIDFDTHKSGDVKKFVTNLLSLLSNSSENNISAAALQTSNDGKSFKVDLTKLNTLLQSIIGQIKFSSQEESKESSKQLAHISDKQLIDILSENKGVLISINDAQNISNFQIVKNNLVETGEGEVSKLEDAAATEFLVIYKEKEVSTDQDNSGSIGLTFAYTGNINPIIAGLNNTNKPAVDINPENLNIDADSSNKVAFYSYEQKPADTSLLINHQFNTKNKLVNSNQHQNIKQSEVRLGEKPNTETSEVNKAIPTLTTEISDSKKPNDGNISNQQENLKKDVNQKEGDIVVKLKDSGFKINKIEDETSLLTKTSSNLGLDAELTKTKSKEGISTISTENLSPKPAVENIINSDGKIVNSIVPTVENINVKEQIKKGSFVNTKSKEQNSSAQFKNVQSENNSIDKTTDKIKTSLNELGISGNSEIIKDLENAEIKITSPIVSVEKGDTTSNKEKSIIQDPNAQSLDKNIKSEEPNIKLGTTKEPIKVDAKSTQNTVVNPTVEKEVTKNTETVKPNIQTENTVKEEPVKVSQEPIKVDGKSTQNTVVNPTVEKEVTKNTGIVKPNIQTENIIIEEPVKVTQEPIKVDGKSSQNTVVNPTVEKEVTQNTETVKPNIQTANTVKEDPDKVTQEPIKVDGKSSQNTVVNPTVEKEVTKNAEKVKPTVQTENKAKEEPVKVTQEPIKVDGKSSQNTVVNPTVEKEVAKNTETVKPNIQTENTIKEEPVKVTQEPIKVDVKSSQNTVVNPAVEKDVAKNSETVKPNIQTENTIKEEPVKVTQEPIKVDAKSSQNTVVNPTVEKEVTQNTETVKPTIQTENAIKEEPVKVTQEPIKVDGKSTQNTVVNPTVEKEVAKNSETVKPNIQTENTIKEEPVKVTQEPIKVDGKSTQNTVVNPTVEKEVAKNTETVKPNIQTENTIKEDPVKVTKEPIKVDGKSSQNTVVNPTVEKEITKNTETVKPNIQTENTVKEEPVKVNSESKLNESTKIVTNNKQADIERPNGNSKTITQESVEKPVNSKKEVSSIELHPSQNKVLLDKSEGDNISQKVKNINTLDNKQEIFNNISDKEQIKTVDNKSTKGLSSSMLINKEDIKFNLNKNVPPQNFGVGNEKEAVKNENSTLSQSFEKELKENVVTIKTEPNSSKEKLSGIVSDSEKNVERNLKSSETETTNEKDKKIATNIATKNNKEPETVKNNDEKNQNINEDNTVNLKVNKTVKNIVESSNEGKSGETIKPTNEKMHVSASDTTTEKTQSVYDKTVAGSESAKTGNGGTEFDNKEQKENNSQLNVKIGDIDNKDKKVFDETIVKNYHEKNVKLNEVIKEVSRYLEKQDKGSLTINIEPENMGKVRISVEVNDKLVRANIIVENETVKNLLESKLGDLQSNLNKNGNQGSMVNISLQENEQKNAKHNSNRKKNGSEEKNIDSVENIEESVKKSMGYNTVEYLA